MNPHVFHFIFEGLMKCESECETRTEFKSYGGQQLHAVDGVLDAALDLLTSLVPLWR